MNVGAAAVLKAALGRLLCKVGRHQWRLFGVAGGGLYVVCRRCQEGRWEF